jgi:hypothetical protein
MRQTNHNPNPKRQFSYGVNLDTHQSNLSPDRMSFRRDRLTGLMSFNVFET